MELKYQRLVACRGEAEPLCVRKFSNALPAARAFQPQRNRQPSSRTLINLQNVARSYEVAGLQFAEEIHKNKNLR